MKRHAPQINEPLSSGNDSLLFQSQSHCNRSSKLPKLDNSPYPLFTFPLRTESQFRDPFENKKINLIPSKSFNEIKPEGSGFYGIVYRAKWHKNQQETKTVVLKRANSTTPPIQHSLINEAKMLAEITHPNIIKMFGCCYIANELYIVMEFMEKGNLNDQLSNSILDWVKKLEIIHDVAKGLQHLHELCIMHRDIRPHNVVLNEDMHAKLIDFGIAKSEEDLIDVERNEDIKYLPFRVTALEILTEKEIYSFAADIYSFGLLMWQIATHIEPWQEVNEVETMIEILKSNNKPTSKLPPNTPKVIHSLIQRCWSNQKEERPSITQITAELQASKYENQLTPL